MKKILTILTVAIFIVIGLSFNDKTEKPKSQVVFAVPASEVTKWSLKYISVGYIVKFMVSESVTTSINNGGQNGYNKYHDDHRDLKGLIIVTMEK